MTVPREVAGLAEAVLGAADIAGIGVSIISHDAAGPHYVHMNDAALKILGRTRDEMTSGVLLDYIAPEERDTVLQLSLTIAQGQPAQLPRLEITLLRPDGGRVPVRAFTAELDLGGKPSSITFFWDISDRLEVEKARLAEADRLTRVFGSAPDGIAVLRNGTLVQINPAGARLLGFERPEDLLGVAIASLMLPEEVPMLVRRMKAAAEGAPQPSQVYRVRHKNGAIISAEVSSIPFFHEGKPALLAFVRDVTERGQLQEQMARAERLASLSTLAAGLAHEINNPLTAAMLQLDVIEQRIAGSLAPGPRNEVFERIGELRKTHERIADIMRDFAAFARSGVEKREKVDVLEIVAGVERMLAPAFAKKGRYINALEQLPLIEADHSRLEQVFLNLLLNAVQALPEGREGNEVKISGRALGDGRVCVEVTDNGMGITTENLRRVFDPFFTTKPIGVGTGLGLTVSHNIVSSLGGEIQIDSVSGHGCTMRVLLPAAQGRSKTRVMIVDDEPNIASSLRQLLEDRHEVVATTRSEQAVRILLEGASIDVVVCDLMMPEPNGIEVFRQVTEKRPELRGRFIFMTGGVYNRETERFFETTPAPRVEKPFDQPALEQLIARIASGP